MSQSTCTPALRSFDLFANPHVRGDRSLSGWAESTVVPVYLNVVSMRSSMREPPRRGASPDNHQLVAHPGNVAAISRELSALTTDFVGDICFLSANELAAFSARPHKPGLQHDSQEACVNAAVMFVRSVLANVRAEVRATGVLDGVVDPSVVPPKDSPPVVELPATVEAYSAWINDVQGMSQAAQVAWARSVLLAPGSLPPALTKLLDDGSDKLRKTAAELALTLHDMYVSCALCYPQMRLPFWTVGEWVTNDPSDREIVYRVEESRTSAKRIVVPGVLYVGPGDKMLLKSMCVARKNPSRTPQTNGP